MKSFTCDICGRVIEDENEEKVVQRAQHHYEMDHGMDEMTDVQQPNIARSEEDIREKIENK